MGCNSDRSCMLAPAKATKKRNMAILRLLAAERVTAAERVGAAGLGPERLEVLPVGRNRRPRRLREGRLMVRKHRLHLRQHFAEKLQHLLFAVDAPDVAWARLIVGTHD